jgi:hypothetical protein
LGQHALNAIYVRIVKPPVRTRRGLKRKKPRHQENQRDDEKGEEDYDGQAAM